MDDTVRDLAARLAEGTSSAGDGTYLRRGVVTAVNTGTNVYTVTIGGASVPGVPAYRGVSAAVNDSVDILFDGPAPRIIGVVGVGSAGAAALPAPRFYTVNVNSPVMTANVWYEHLVQNSILVVPVACVMEVEAFYTHGFSASNNTLSAAVRDEAGGNITHGATAWTMTQRAAQYDSSSVRGIKTYAPGATAGFRLAFAVDTQNVYLNGSVRVSFHTPA